MKFKFLIISLILTLFFFSHPHKASCAGSLKTYTIANGLLDSSINCIYQDNNGIVWFGSNKGLTRFDGINFKSFRISNVDERIKVLKIYQDKDGIMWVITEIGVKIWTGVEFTDVFVYRGLTSFCIDSEGNKWLGSDNGIMVLGEGLDERGAHTIKSIKNVTTLFKDKDSNIWIGTENGVYLFDGLELAKFSKENDELAGNIVNAIYEDDEYVNFATDGGVSLYNGVNWHSYTVDDGLADNFVTSVYKDFKGQLWLGTASGLSIYDDNAELFYDAWSTMTTEDGLADNHITSLLLDKSANLWIGTKNGVTKNSLSIDYFIKVQRTDEKLLAPVFIDSMGKIWFSSEKGAVTFFENEYLSMTEEDSGISGKLLTIYEDKEENMIYLGTTYGINEYEDDTITATHKHIPNKRLERFNAAGGHEIYESMPEKDEGLVGKKIFAIEKDVDGYLWFATEMALNRLSDSTWTTYTTEEGLLSNKVYSLCSHSDGTLYIGTKYGINKYVDGEISEETITGKNGLLSEKILSLLEDQYGILWIGTSHGVSRYDDGNITNITVETGLAGDDVNVIFEDSNGYLWFASEDGLTKYDGESMSIYTTEDGLMVNEVLSIAEDSDGFLLFGTDEGTMKFKPDLVPPTSAVLNVPDEPIVIPKHTFEVTGADLNSSKLELFYSYKLDDGKWSKFSPKPVINVENLINGTHQLYVRAKDKALNVQKDPLVVSFEVNTKKFDIEIVDIKFNEVFSVLYQHYNSLNEVKEDLFGTITLKSNFDKDIKIKVNSFIKDYMDFPADTRSEVKANTTVTIPIRLEFNENVLTAPSGYKKVNLNLQYYLHGENKENSINSTIMIHDMNTITWDDPKKIGSFITVKDKVLNNFVRSVIQTYKDESKGSIIYGNLIRAMEIFDAFSAYGIRYIADPTSPYAGLKAKENALDTLRFPKQTLALKSGDCDDCVVLFCSALENIGINTAVIDTYDHLFMMFDVGLKKDDLAQITTKPESVFIDDDDKVWIPVETTLFGKTFSYAWESGAQKLKNVKNKTIYYIEEAWKEFRPAEISSTDEEVAKIIVPTKEMIDKIYKPDVAIQEAALIDTLVSKYEAVLKENPDDVQTINSLGILYGKNGYFDKAKARFKRVIELRPDYSGGHSNLGNILFEKGYYDKSVKEYKKALILDSENAYVYLELAIAYSMVDDFVNAKKAYLNAIKADPDVEVKFIGSQ